MKLINTGSEFVELKDDGTYTQYKSKFIKSGRHAIRIDTDPNGKESAAIVLPKILMSVDSITGEIAGVQRQGNIDVNIEILGVPQHPDSGKEFVQVNESDIPDNFEDKDPVTKSRRIRYKYDKTHERLVLKV